MGNFQKYWSLNVGQDFIVLDFFVGGISCGRKRCVREINVSCAWDPVYAGDKALTLDTPAKRGRVNRYELDQRLLTCLMRILMISIYLHILIVFTFYWDTTHITNTFSINFIFWIPNTKMSFWFKFKWWSQRKKLKKLKSQSLFEPHVTVKHNVLYSANQDFDFLILILKHVFIRFIPIPITVKKIVWPSVRFVIFSDSS